MVNQHTVAEKERAVRFGAMGTTIFVVVVVKVMVV